MAPGRKETSLVLIFVLVTLLWAGALAQSSCANVIISMSPCLNYITGNSSTPSSQCCTQLASVVHSQPQCLCEVLNGGGSSLGLNINQTQAMALPGACNVQTPPISQNNSSANLFYTSICMSTAASPADSPAKTPESPTTIPSGGGSKTAPSTGDGTSDGSSVKSPMSLVFAVLFAASHMLQPHHILILSTLSLPFETYTFLQIIHD